MGRKFGIADENLTLGTGNVLFALNNPAAPNAGSFIKILRLQIFQRGTSTGAQCAAEWYTRDTAGTLTMSSITPRNLSVGGPSSAFSGNTAPAGATGRVGSNSSADSSGTYTSLDKIDFNNLNGHLWIPSAYEEMYFPPSTLWGVRFIAAPGTTTGWGYSMEFEELF